MTGPHSLAASALIRWAERTAIQIDMPKPARTPTIIPKGAVWARTVGVIMAFIVVLLIAVWLWTLLSPRMGQTQELRWQGHRRHYAVAIAAGLAIGFYDGILGPGTGSFLLIVLVAGLGYSFLNASSTAKVVNLGTNVAAIIVFGITGSILWLLGLLMGLCNMAGAIIGARMAIRRGSGFVRIVFLAVVGVLILRLAWDLRG